MKCLIDSAGVECFYCETIVELLQYWLQCRDHPFEIVCPASVVLYWQDIEQRVSALRDGVNPMVFVFGSNLAGIHGAGAAKHALEHEGAIMRNGIGRSGNSFAIPTKDESIKTLPLDRIATYVDYFKVYAEIHPEEEFNVTRIGCGLAGYTDTDIAPMFKDSPSNAFLPEGWRKLNGEVEVKRRGDGLQ